MTDTHGHQDPINHPEVQMASGTSHIAGFLLTLGLMLASFELVVQHTWDPLKLMIVTSVLAWVAVTLQVFLLFQLDFSETQRWNLLALILMIPLFVLVIVLTWWMFQSLGARTMIPAIGM